MNSYTLLCIDIDVNYIDDNNGGEGRGFNWGNSGGVGKWGIRNCIQGMGDNVMAVVLGEV